MRKSFEKYIKENSVLSHKTPKNQGEGEKLYKLKYYVIGFIVGLFFVGSLSYASGSRGTIGELFQFLSGTQFENNKLVQNSYRLNGENIKDKTVTQYELADNSVYSRIIAPGAIKSSDIGAGEIKTNNIGNLQVTKEKLANDSVDSSKIVNHSIQREDVAIDFTAPRSDSSSHSNTATNSTTLNGHTYNDIMDDVDDKLPSDCYGTNRFLQFKNGSFICSNASVTSVSTPTPIPTPTPTPSPTPVVVSGAPVCGTQLNSCKSGTFEGTYLGGTEKHVWYCKGSGGAQVTCEIPKGLCGTNKNSCAQGVFSDLTDNTSNYIWMCKGQNNASDSVQCTYPKALGSSAENGECGWGINLCNKGVPFDLFDSSSDYRWRCDGRNGGSNSSVCTFSKPLSGSKIDGQCGVTTNTCLGGSTLFDIIDTGANYRWKCTGKNGGRDSGICTSPRESINGKCGTNLYSCKSGVSLNLDNTAMFGNPIRHVWACEGINGGTRDACLTLLKTRCGKVKNKCVYGIVSNKRETGTSYNWRCDAGNGVPSTNCFIKK